MTAILSSLSHSGQTGTYVSLLSCLLSFLSLLVLACSSWPLTRHFTPPAAFSEAQLLGMCTCPRLLQRLQECSLTCGFSGFLGCHLPKRTSDFSCPALPWLRAAHPHRLLPSSCQESGPQHLRSHLSSRRSRKLLKSSSQHVSNCWFIIANCFQKILWGL